MNVSKSVASSLAYVAMYLPLTATHAAVTAQDLLYVGFDHQISVYDASGNLTNNFAAMATVLDLTADEFGVTYAVSLNLATLESRIEKFDAAGNSLGNIFTQTSPDTFLQGIVIGADGSLYVGRNGANDTIERFTPDGTPLGTFATISTPVPGAPFAIDFDTAGNSYVTDERLIESFDSGGQSLGTFAAVDLSPLSLAIDMAFDSSGNLYVGTTNDGIQVFDQFGALLNTLQISNVSAIEIDDDDNLFVAVRGSGRTPTSVQKRTLDGQFLETFASNLPGVPIDLAFSRVIPEPSTLVLTSGSTIVFARRKRPFVQC